MITERILQILDIKKITKYKFCKDLSLSNGFLDKPRDISTSKYANILDYFPDINPHWLLTGNGEMIKQSHQKTPDVNRIEELQEMIDMQRKLIKNLESEIARLQRKLEKTHNFPTHRMVAEDELTYAKKKK